MKAPAVAARETAASEAMSGVDAACGVRLTVVAAPGVADTSAEEVPVRPAALTAVTLK